MNGKLRSKKLINDKEVTILNCSEKEFNIRWWGFGISIALFGVFMGYILRGLV